ncbi:MAG: polyribonucleotide nucleotidyltransferase [Candidatus Roizmanbacteria bacterium]|nr:polyribonucleotide nucleotidyltransferase [Candidatus Roizmanbacteria bacterium]
MKVIEKSLELGNEQAKRTLSFQTGKLAKAATIAVLGRMGDTSLLVTIVAGAEREDLDYFPLQVEYAEKLYAGGIIKGSRWVKREGRPSDEAVLTGRLIDRSIRPLFPKGYKKNVQIIITLMSIDGVNSPDILAALTVSAALQAATIPFKGPIATSRVGAVKNGEVTFIVNPTEEDQKFSVLDLVVSSSEEKVVMIETRAEELKEDLIEQGIELAKIENRKLIAFIMEFAKAVGNKKDDASDSAVDEKLLAILKQDFRKEIEALVAQKAKKEFEDKAAVEEVVNAVSEKHADEFDKKTIAKGVDYMTKQVIRDNILLKKRVLPRIHGSALFSRGDTQVLTIVTLGAPSLEQLIESPEGEESKRYIHHYNMPPYSVGETGRFGFSSRREIGHGALAEKAIEPVLPAQKDFPYTIRVVSEVLSSNGSTSQASTCASTLALMDAGVPIKALVAGIAMGIVSKTDDDFVVLTDILGVEDFSGEMDFKIAGSETGVTAIQLDVKNMGLTTPMMHEAIVRATAARMKILANMKAAIASPRDSVSKFAPKVVVITPPADKIGEIIGPGGKNIRALIAQTNTDINVGDDGRVTISGIDKANVDMAAKMIENMTREIQVGEIFEGEVKRIAPFGAFVECIPGKDGLVHVSKMGRGFVKDPAEVVSVGQKVKVKVMEIDNMGRINLQMFGEDGSEPQAGSPPQAGGMGGPAPRYEQRPRPSYHSRPAGPGGNRPRYNRSDRNDRPPMRGNDRRQPAPIEDDFLKELMS